MELMPKNFFALFEFRNGVRDEILQTIQSITKLSMHTLMASKLTVPSNLKKAKVIQPKSKNPSTTGRKKHKQKMSKQRFKK